MTIALLAIGTELTRGEASNGNGRWMAEALTAVGRAAVEISCVDDDLERLERVLLRLGNEHDFVIATGGLGPTTDDLTREGVARCLGCAIRTDPESLEHLRQRVAARGRVLTTSVAKMASLPEVSTVVANPVGAAIGFEALLGRARCWFLPGVPKEAKAMFEATILPVIATAPGPRAHQVILRTVGLLESVAGEQLAGLEEGLGITIGYRVHIGELEVKVLALRATEAEAKRACEEAVAQVKSRLGAHLYGEGVESLASVTAHLLSEHGLTLALAESCTGGLAASLFTKVAGVSGVFRGGVVAYANDVKTNLLGVPLDLLQSQGAVSEGVARAMAEGARGRLQSDLCLSFTGIAGPDGGTEIKPVGRVHYALATPEGTLARVQDFAGGRTEIQQLAVSAGLELLRRWLLEAGCAR
jgi:nicotinamide-nucleotide amidase